MVRVAVPLALQPEQTRPPAGRLVRLSGPTMGVSWSLVGVAPEKVADAAIADACQAAANRVVAQMSTWEPDSDISRFNRAPAGWVSAPADLMRVVVAGLEVGRLSGGAFDPTVGALVDLWGFGPTGRRTEPPSGTALPAAAPLDLDSAGGRIRQAGGTRIDLSGIAKGFGVDRLAEAAASLGLTAFLVEIGGELRGRGVKPNGEPWFVDVEAPPGLEQTLEPLRVALVDLAIASSGDWRRVFTHKGRTFSHTLDPATGRPIDNGVASVTVLHPQCMYADAWCTALAVLGAEDGLALADRLGLAAVFRLRTADGCVERVSRAFAAMLD